MLVKDSIGMTETEIRLKAPKGGRWLRRLIWMGGVSGALLVGLYFVATSSAFIKGVVLPRVGRAINAEVSVADIQLSPFTSIVLHDLKVTPKGAEPVFAAAGMQIGRAHV
jgi:hypothetical protein